METQELHRGRLIDHLQLVVRDLAPPPSVNDSSPGEEEAQEADSPSAKHIAVGMVSAKTSGSVWLHWACARSVGVARFGRRMTCLFAEVLGLNSIGILKD